MPKNIQPMTEEDSNIPFSALPGDMEHIESVEEKKRTIIPLHILLNDVPLEKLLALIQSLNVSFTLGGKGHDFLKRKRNFECRIWGKGIVDYQSGGASPQQALLNALVKFFVGEQKDIHEYK